MASVGRLWATGAFPKQPAGLVPDDVLYDVPTFSYKLKAEPGSNRDDAAGERARDRSEI